MSIKLLRSSAVLLVTALTGTLSSAAILGAAQAHPAQHQNVHAAKHHRHRHHAPRHRAHRGIPQHNGGDHDADNNGGPSDGDGNV